MRGGCWPAFGKSELGVCGVVGGMTVIVMLAYTMRQDCSGIVEVEYDIIYGRV